MIAAVEAYPDATLASVLSVALAGVGCGRLLTGEVLMGTAGAAATAELPIHIRRLASAIGPRLGCDEHALIVRHTMLPAYAPWVSPHLIARVTSAMCGDGPARPHAILGTHACRTKPPTFLRFCPLCRERELDLYQAAWWHRAHQGSGIHHCSIHGCRLVESQFRRGGSWKLDYPTVERARGRVDDAEECPWSVGIAEDFAWLLMHEVPALGPEAIRTVYLEALERKGFVGRRLRRTDFLREFHEAFGACYLRRSGLSFDPSGPYAWPAKLAVGAGECHPPIRHLHLLRFLGFDAASFFARVVAVAGQVRGREKKTVSNAAAEYLRVRWNDPTLSIHGMSVELGVEQHTVRTWASSLGLSLPRFPTAEQLRRFKVLRRSMRATWYQVRNDNDDGQRRRVLKWISRNDAAWLMRHRRTRPASSSAHWAAWAERDQELLARLPQALRCIRDHRPFRRVCHHSIAAVLGATAFLQKSCGRLPRFKAAIERATESHRQFALRRIYALRRSQPHAPRWKIRDLASIPRPLPGDPAIRQALGYPRNFIYHGHHSN